MICERAKLEMLEAGPAALRGVGESTLARHLRECATCRAAAARLVAMETELGAALERARPRRSAAEAAESALAAVGRAPSAPRAPSTRARRGWVAVPLAAAAALAALLLGRPGSLPVPGASERQAVTGGSAIEATEEEPPATFAVEVPADRRLAVFETRDPTIKVVWIF